MAPVCWACASAAGGRGRWWVSARLFLARVTRWLIIQQNVWSFTRVSGAVLGASVTRVQRKQTPTLASQNLQLSEGDG